MDFNKLMIEINYLNLEEAYKARLNWPDMYFSPEYGRIVETSDEGSWECAIWDHGRIVYPYLKRDIRDGSFDIISPYGYAGIYIAPDVTTCEVSAFRTEFRTHMKNSGCVSEFLRLSDISSSTVKLSTADPELSINQHNSTVLIDLSKGYDAFFAQAQGRARTKIRKAGRLGYTTEIRRLGEADLSRGSTFRTLYKDTMDGLAASQYYYFNDEYFARFYTELGHRGYLIEAKSAEGDTVMVGFFIEYAPLLHLHLVGSTKDALRDGVGTLIYDRVAYWGAENDAVKSMHVGGGTRDGDSLYKFKISFGGTPQAFKIGTSILNPELYETLIADHASDTGVSVVNLQHSGFFPAYRASIVAE